MMNLIKKPMILGLAVAMMMGCASSDEIELFNGKDLSGWTVYGTEKWYVEDGVLVSESGLMLGAGRSVLLPPFRFIKIPK